jgi:hypothetical protein
VEGHPVSRYERARWGVGVLRLLLFSVVFVCACSDYMVHKQQDGENAGEEESIVVDTGTEEPIPSEPEDTGLSSDTGESNIETPDEPVYLHTGSTLYAWDPLDGQLQLIGDFWMTGAELSDGITDIAIDDLGRFYGVGAETLYGINGHTAEVWEIADLSLPMFGLTCTSDGRLVGGGDGLYEVDVVTGEVTTIVPEGRFETSGDLVGLPDGLLYWAVREGDGLVVVDPNSGATSTRGEIGVERIFGLGYAHGALYGFTDAGIVLEINASTGAVISSHSLPGTWWGATTNPVVW